jgi:thiol-disulfide isomerase/thioredoxin
MYSALAALMLASLIPVQAQTPTSVPSPASRKQAQPTIGPPRGSRAPDFALESLNGETVHLSDFRDKVVLLNFWATWCTPCKIMTPWFVEMQNQYGPQGLQIVGVALDEDATKVGIGESADELRVNYSVLIGNGKVASAYGGLPMLPTSFIVGRNGRIIDTIIGLKSKSELEDEIKKALRAQPQK